jgi:hypothetical protein
MSNKVLIKRSSNSGVAPTSLEYGELAINIADSILFYKDNNNSIKSFSLIQQETNNFVTSVAGRVGDVVLTKNDVGLLNVDNTADSTKNVLSATKLTTPRTINSVSFDGSSNITITDSTKQPLDNDLTAIAALSGTSGFLKKTATDTWTLDTSTYVTSSGVTSVTGTAPIVSSGGTTPAISISAATTSSAGSMSAADKTKLDAISGTNTGDETATTIKSKLGISTLSGSNTGDQTITLTGDVTGSGTGSFATTLSNSGVTAGTYTKVTVDAKGRVTTGSTLLASDVPTLNQSTTGNAATATLATTATTANALNTSNAYTGTSFNSITALSSTTPSMNGTAAVGTSTTVARADHVHASDTSKASLSGATFTGSVSGTTFSGTSFNSITALSSTTPVMNGTAAVGTSTTVARADHVHASDTSRSPLAGSTSITTLGTITTGTWNGSSISDTYLSTISTSGKVSNSATTATSANTASAIVARDSSGNFTAGTITATLTGNSDTSTTLATSRTIQTNLASTSSASFNGSANVTPGVTGTLPVTNGGTGTTTSTGSGSVVLSTSPTLVTPVLGVATGTSFNSITALSSTTPLMNGTATVGTSTTVARADHVHATDTSRMSNSQALAITGDVTASSTALNTGTIATTLASVGTAGTYTKVTTDAKGRVTSGTTLTMEDIPSASYKKSVVVATTANITLSAAQTIDDIAVVAGDRVLVKDQTTASQNGIYVVNASTWTRALDADTVDEIASAIVNVDKGTVNGGQVFTNTFKSTDTLGTTSMPWYKGMYESGTWGISVSGNAATATKLATARTINGVSFDGTANITVADSTKEPTITAGTTAQYWRGDKSWQTLNASAVGLGNVSNTAQVTSVTGTAPIVSSGGTTPAISISAATTSAAGSMSATDKTKLDGISGTNTGDETTATIKTKLGITTLSGSNTGDQTITLTGDVTGSGTGSFATTLANSGVTAGTYTKVTTDAKGRITSGTTLSASDIPTLNQNTTGSSGSCTGNSATATTSTYINAPDGSRVASDRLPTTNARTVRYDFCGAASTGTGGNYAGVMTYAPWDGTTSSTGDASYQVAFGSTATNGGGIPQINVRKGIDSTWNSWYTLLHTGNYNSYAPTLTGTGASGTWGINISGNAATATYLSATQQSNAIFGANKPTSMVVNDSTNNGSFVCRASGTGDGNLAGMTFWNDTYTLKLGVRSDGAFGLGGWSRAAWSWYSDPGGNMVASGNVTAYSDPRLKENFVNIKDPITLVKKLNGGTFNWKHGFAHTEVKAGKKDYGILANEVEAIMPEIVTESIEIEGEKYKTVCYEKIVPLLIEAIKEQQKQIDELTALVKGA